MPRDWRVELTPPRRRYVQDFFRQQGYDPSNLRDDQLAAVFALLARVEEYFTHLRHNGHNWEVDYAPDSHLRHAADPLIERWISEWVAKRQLVPLSGSVSRWPQGRRFALCLTHDMDTLKGDVFWHRLRSLPTYHEAPFREKAIVAASTLRALYRKCARRNSVGDPPLAEWMEEEGRHGFNSSFFFLAQPLPAPHWQDSFDHYDDRVIYDGRRITIRDAMKQIAAADWDVGLHGSSRSHTSASLLAREREIVSAACGREVVTTRQHHLFFDARVTPLCQYQAGLKADSTLGSNNRTCFRCGTGLPYYWYDLIDDVELDLLIAPLVIQDVALFSVLQMDVDTAVHHCVQILQRVANLGGAVTLLWHNNHFQDETAFIVYKTLLAEAKAMNAWGCSLRQLTEWCEQRRAAADSWEVNRTAPASRRRALPKTASALRTA